MKRARLTGSSNNSFWRTSESFCPRRRQAKAALFSNKALFAFLAGEQKSSTCRSKAIIRATLIHGFTLLEVLTALAIVAIMVGLLIPAIGMVEKTAKTVKQKSQFHAIEIALEAFRSDWGDYPPSSYTNVAGITAAPATSDGYCGAQKLAEAVIGMDGFGFHPKSKWRSDGLGDVNGDGVIDEPLYYGAAGYAALTPAQNAENLKARKGPYLELEKANAVKLYNLYTDPGGGMFGALAKDTYVLCDMFGLVKNTATGKKTGLPILYFRADTSKSYWRPTTLGSYPWTSDTSPDAVYNVNENFPFFYYSPNGYTYSFPHPMSDGRVFYNRIKNPNYPGTLANSYKDARPYRAQTFILLSAGPDGLYGTSDDVYNIDENEK